MDFIENPRSGFMTLVREPVHVFRGSKLVKWAREKGQTILMKCASQFLREFFESFKLKTCFSTENSAVI